MSKPVCPLPFQVDDITRAVEHDALTDAERSPSPDSSSHDGKHRPVHRVGEKTRFANRVLDLRVRILALYTLKRG